MLLFIDARDTKVITFASQKKKRGIIREKFFKNTLHCGSI